MKAAFSDALKRAAVKLGVGRYLYRLGGQWVDHDEKARQFKRTPTLPAWAVANGTVQPRLNGAEQGPAAGITSQQWDKIQAALVKSGGAARVLLDYFAVAKPSDLPAGKFTEAMRMAGRPSRACQGDKVAVA